ncbi:hypothetical protein sos41_22730 [Alphaproteobacteria bacterium SO-S41]|nr:hypothetical protein sos41_22730 [Alphaproteobacteria bacterium SO-S41]
MTNDDPKFHRWVDPAGRGAVKSHHKVEAAPAELLTLAAWLGIPRVFALRADLEVERVSSSEVAVSGTFFADVELTCGVSLEDFRQKLDGPVSGRFRKPDGRAPKHEAEEAAEIVIDLDTEEPGEWRPQGVDLGGLIAEELSLALPEFPRKPDATLDLTEAAAPDEKPNPFAVLTRLKTPPRDGT